LQGERVWRITETTNERDQAYGTQERKKVQRWDLTKTKLGEKCGRDDEVIAIQISTDSHQASNPCRALVVVWK
jgi:hypothetical protein